MASLLSGWSCVCPKAAVMSRAANAADLPRMPLKAPALQTVNGKYRTLLSGALHAPRLRARTCTVLLDQAENNLFEIDRELRQRWMGADIVPVVADITDAARIRQDIGALEAVISRVNTYTTKTIAHRDDNPRRVPAAPAVTWAELDAAVDAVGGIYKKYYRLRHPGEALGALTPLKSPGWIQMFQTAWMPPGFIPPDGLDFEPATSMW